MTDEILDILDNENKVVGYASYDDVHAKKLPHPVVHALLFNSKGDMLLQLRSASKSAYPSHWSFAIGGHVRHGENFQQALVREAQEEVGITVSENDFLYKGEGNYVDERGHSIFYQTYEIIYDGPVAEKTEEVDAVQFVSWEELKHWIKSRKEKLQPEFVQVLQRYWQDKLNG